ERLVARGGVLPAGDDLREAAPGHHQYKRGDERLQAHHGDEHRVHGTEDRSEQQCQPQGGEGRSHGAACGGEELHGDRAGHGHQRADGEVDAGGRDDQAHSHRDHRDRGGRAQDVDQVADQTAGALVVADRQITGILGGVDGQQQGDRDDAPEVRPTDQTDQRRGAGGGVVAHELAPVSTGCELPGSAAGFSAIVAMIVSLERSSSAVSSASLRRSFSTTIRSLRRTTSSSSEEMNTTATPSSVREMTSSMISVLAPMSMPRVGSSRISTSGWVASQRPSSTFCWLPPERLLIGRSGSAGRTLSAAMYFSTSAFFSWVGSGR